MTIADTREKCKSLLGRVPRDLIIILVLLTASLASFGLGYLAGQDSISADREGGQGSGLSVTAENGRIVASKTGTKYYLPTCPGADRISETNKVWFVSAVAALSAGYSPAANCNGL